MTRAVQARLRARVIQHVAVGTIVLGGSLLIGIWGYTYFDGMSLLDGFLNASMILSGMGPVGELKTESAKIFAGCYALYSGVAFLGVTGFVFTPVIHHVLLRFKVEDV
jgi:hypothetical protein